MRQLTEIEISRIKLLTENSVELTLIEPTATGLEKSIMDATGSVRTYLKSKSIHNCFLLSTNIRCENALINFRLKTKYLNNNLFIFSFGSKFNSDFNINFININPSNTLQFFEGKNKNISLLKCYRITGRTHQMRVQ
jgi:hypothetical protein